MMTDDKIREIADGRPSGYVVYHDFPDGSWDLFHIRKVLIDHGYDLHRRRDHPWDCEPKITPIVYATT